MAAVTGEDIAVIVRALIDKAKAGDVAAARLVLQYTLGKPAATVDPDRLDEMEWEQWQREQASMDSDKVWTGMHASTANTIARTIVPVMQKEHFAELYHQLQEREEERREEEAEDREDEVKEERNARRGERRSNPAAAPPTPSPAREQTPRRESPPSVSPVETPKAESDGQSTPAEDRSSAMDWILRMLDPTVTKREETVRRAANDFSDDQSQQR